MKFKKNRVLSGLCAAMLCVSLAACGTPVDNVNGTDTTIENQESSVSESSQSVVSQESAVSSEEVVESSSEEVPEPEIPAQIVIPDFSPKALEFESNEALDFIKDMKIGWNYGNAFDAYDCNWLSNDVDYESGWTNAKATPELFDTLKAAGFNTIRIPVSWHNHVSSAPDYIINEAWLDRVNEVVDYCIDRDLYVIIDIHHDNNTQYLYPTSQYLDQSVTYVTAIWEQLSQRFMDYDNHLIFAGMNEPRMVGHNNEWWLNDSEDCKDAVSCVNVLNQAFVDTVRASGGNNTSRYLICPGYDASPDGALNSGFVFPTDPAGDQNRIILSIHAYTPYNFALEMPGVTEWSYKKSSDVNNMTGFMNKIYNAYVSKGIPVIIDEFGALRKGDNLQSRVEFAAYYVAAARCRGITCIWWDNSAIEGDGELFGIINRNTCEWLYPEIAEAMMRFADFTDKTE